jgi:hypothetical protein
MVGSSPRFELCNYRTQVRGATAWSSLSVIKKNVAERLQGKGVCIMNRRITKMRKKRNGENR